MKKISEVINEKLFINSYYICKSLCEKDFITDVNLKLIKNMLNSITEENAKKYYKNYIETEFFYSIPCLFSTDIVHIPKNINGLREYRFFSTTSMILYNAIGLLFVDICNNFLREINFEKNSIYRFMPTILNKDKRGNWTAKNEYPKMYGEYSKKLNDNLEEGDAILKIDISNFFGTIKYNKLIDILIKYGSSSMLEYYKINDESKKTLLFYFQSLMNQKQGIPQGKVNCTSDFLGHLYLLPLDISIRGICKNSKLEFKSMIRYVDDTIVIFKNNNQLDNKEIYKELSNIEQKISTFLNQQLSLKINDQKVEYSIITDKDEFVQYTIKTVSSPEKNNNKNTTELEENIEGLIKTINKYKYPDGNNFTLKITNKDRENLKIILNRNIKNLINREDIKKKIIDNLKSINIELTVREINILIALFFINSHEGNFKEKSNEDDYLNILIDYIMKNLNFEDKRILHIMFLMVCNNFDFTRYNEFNNYIKINQEKLLKDNYGKYLLIFTKNIKYDEYNDITADDSIFYQINYEYNKKSKYVRNFVVSNNTKYYELISKILLQGFCKTPIINQLKEYVYNVRNENYDVAFNHFQNIFQEICKEKLSLGDNCNVNHIVDNLYKNNIISIQDEILIRKFYDTRNFNIISHPSKNGQSSIKVAKETLNKFKDGILKIAIMLLDYPI